MPFAELDAVRLHYSLEGDAGRPVLVLSNSLGASIDMWAPQRERWLREFRLLRYDTRGHGQSSVPSGPYRFDQLAQDVVGLLDRLGIERVHFCGLSMGGVTGQWLALHHASRIDRLVLANTAAYLGPPENWQTRAGTVERDGMAALVDAVVARWLTPACAAEHPDRLATLKAMLMKTPPAGYAANCRALAANDLRGEVAAIRHPTLVISGNSDAATTTADAEFLLARIPGARGVRFDAAHLSNWEQVDSFSAAVSDFLLQA